MSPGADWVVLPLDAPILLERAEMQGETSFGPYVVLAPDQKVLAEAMRAYRAAYFRALAAGAKHKSRTPPEARVYKLWVTLGQLEKKCKGPAQRQRDHYKQRLASEIAKDRQSAEGIAEHAWFGFLVSACVRRTSGKRVFLDLEDYRRREGESWVADAARRMNMLLLDFDANGRLAWPESVRERGGR